MAGMPPDVFAARLAAVRDHLLGLARDASDELFDGMATIAESAVERLVERTPRSEGSDAFLDVAVGDHIADGWTARESTVTGGVSIEIVNTNPRANAPIALKSGGETTLLEILEYGSERHEIVPVNAPFLVFATPGGIVRTKHVDHPGTRPYAMVATTEAEVAIDVKRLIDSTRRTLTLKRIGRQ